MFKNECHSCKKPLDHTEDYFYMMVKRKPYEFCRKCLEEHIINGNLEKWLVAITI